MYWPNSHIATRNGEPHLRQPPFSFRRLLSRNYLVLRKSSPRIRSTFLIFTSLPQRKFAFTSHSPHPHFTSHSPHPHFTLRPGRTPPAQPFVFPTINKAGWLPKAQESFPLDSSPPVTSTCCCLSSPHQHNSNTQSASDITKQTSALAGEANTPRTQSRLSLCLSPSTFLDLEQTSFIASPQPFLWRNAGFTLSSPAQPRPSITPKTNTSQDDGLPPLKVRPPRRVVLLFHRRHQQQHPPQLHHLWRRQQHF